MGIFDSMKKPGEELSDEELNAKADTMDRVVSYYKDRGDKKNQQEEERRWGKRR